MCMWLLVVVDRKVDESRKLRPVRCGWGYNQAVHSETVSTRQADSDTGCS
jgi:hypothetical protein